MSPVSIPFTVTFTSLHHLPIISRSKLATLEQQLLALGLQCPTESAWLHPLPCTKAHGIRWFAEADLRGITCLIERTKIEKAKTM